MLRWCAWWRPKTRLHRVGDLAQRGAGARRLDGSASRLPLPDSAQAVKMAFRRACTAAAVALSRRAFSRATWARAPCRVVDLQDVDLLVSGGSG
jgi:hypothetical protein